MSKQALVKAFKDKLAQKDIHVSAASAEAILTTATDLIVEEAVEMGSIQISNLFKIVKRTRAARQGRNLATGESIEIPAQDYLAIKMLSGGKTLLGQRKTGG